MKKSCIYTAVALLAFVDASASLADDIGFEVIALGEHSNDASNFTLLSFRMPLVETGGNDTRSAFSGLRLRFDVGRADYETSYDSTIGEGRAVFSRVLLSYGMNTSQNSTLTLVGGLSYRETQVRPLTGSAPSDDADYGAFIAAELEVIFPDTGDVLFLLENDSTSGSYASANYLHDFGALRLGPMASYYWEDGYQMSRFGAVAAFDLADDLELRVTASHGVPEVSGASGEGVTSAQLQLRLAF